MGAKKERIADAHNGQGRRSAVVLGGHDMPAESDKRINQAPKGETVMERACIMVAAEKGPVYSSEKSLRSLAGASGKGPRMTVQAPNPKGKKWAQPFWGNTREV